MVVVTAQAKCGRVIPICERLPVVPGNQVHAGLHRKSFQRPVDLDAAKMRELVAEIRQRHPVPRSPGQLCVRLANLALGVVGTDRRLTLRRERRIAWESALDER